MIPFTTAIITTSYSIRCLIAISTQSILKLGEIITVCTLMERFLVTSEAFLENSSVFHVCVVGVVTIGTLRDVFVIVGCLTIRTPSAFRTVSSNGMETDITIHTDTFLCIKHLQMALLTLLSITRISAILAWVGIFFYESLLF